MARDYCYNLIAAQAASLGDAVSGTPQIAVARSFLPGYPLPRADARAHTSAVSEATEAIADSLRGVGAHAAEWCDPDTAALLIEIACLVERDLWRIRPTAADKVLCSCVVADADVDDHPAYRWPERRFQAPSAVIAYRRGSDPEAVSGRRAGAGNPARAQGRLVSQS